MKTKKFCVSYDTPPISYDTVVAANTKEEAMRKVREVIPDSFNVKAWQIDGQPKKGSYTAALP